MKHVTVQLPKIDYEYWSQRNEYFSNAPLIETVRQGLEHAKKGGLIAPILQRNKINTNAQLVELISQCIQSHSKIEDFSDTELLVIFDLIQGWGGKTGRSPYVRPKGSPARLSWECFVKAYRESISLCFKEPFDHYSMLKMLTGLPQVSVSFATKHMFFWTEYGPKKEAVPIYDTRIKTLLCLDEKSAVDFNSFLIALKSHAEKLSMPVSLIERALFSFSQNYFPNNSLRIKLNDLPDRTDFITAKDLEQKYLDFHSNIDQS